MLLDRGRVVAVSFPGQKRNEVEITLNRGEIGQLRTSRQKKAMNQQVRLAPGMRVRLWVASLQKKSLVGTVLSVDPAGIIELQPDSSRVLPSPSPVRIEWDAVELNPST